MTSLQDIQTILAAENVTANWIRNGLITTLIALSIFALIAIERIQTRKNLIAFLKILSIVFILIAIWMFWSHSSIPQHLCNNADISSISCSNGNSRASVLLLILALVVLIFLIIYT
jgi:hypothetical protein